VIEIGTFDNRSCRLCAVTTTSSGAIIAGRAVAFETDAADADCARAGAETTQIVTNAHVAAEFNNALWPQLNGPCRAFNRLVIDLCASATGMHFAACLIIFFSLVRFGRFLERTL
jgi:transposase